MGLRAADLAVTVAVVAVEESSEPWYSADTVVAATVARLEPDLVE